jgi:hypothetical protein
MLPRAPLYYVVDMLVRNTKLSSEVAEHSRFGLSRVESLSQKKHLTSGKFVSVHSLAVVVPKFGVAVAHVVQASSKK